LEKGENARWLRFQLSLTLQQKFSHMGAPAK